jgi:hypothetical protein
VAGIRSSVSVQGGEGESIEFLGKGLMSLMKKDSRVLLSDSGSHRRIRGNITLEQIVRVRGQRGRGSQDFVDFSKERPCLAQLELSPSNFVDLKEDDLPLTVYSVGFGYLAS